MTDTDLTITHTDLEGTTIWGTSKGDGSADQLKANGWRWSRNLGAWYMPRTRNTPVKRHIIDKTRDALTEDGFTVELDIDTTVADRAEVETAQAAREEARAERLTAKAAREQAASDARWAAGRGIAESIPMGQPVLLGHHSQRRAERDRDRIRAHTDASMEHQAKAKDAARRARNAEIAARVRHNPVTVGNLIERLTAEVRKLDRILASQPSNAAYLDRMTEMHERATADLAYWRGVRDAQIADGTAGGWGKHNVKPGDLVQIGGRWLRVARANAKTVAVETGYYWTDKAPWHKVTGHRLAAG